MRRKTLITLLLFAVLLMMANGNMPLLKQRKRAVQSESNSQADTTRRSINKLANLVDTTKMDSIQRAIYRHNKAIDDSIHLDSLNRKKKNGIDAPVTYSGEDSLVYDAKSKVAHIYGSSAVKYENMDLTSDRIQMSLDSSLVRAVGSPDSTEKKGVKGRPLFKMAGSEYESDTIAFNFKTKKGFINNVYTQQEDGYLTSEMSKRDSSGVIYLKHGRYTTCDEEHPDFYIALSRAKVRPGKDVVFGPAYLVVADVPLPLVIPYGFFPFTKKFSSGIIMPSYGDEQDRGFYLRDGGYYFAMGDKWDLKLIGEIYTQGSWGISAASNYRKRYRYNGSFLASFQDTRTGDKGMPDYARQTSFKIQWSHRQDAKANPFSSLSASVNFATSSYERNNLTSLYNPQSLTQSTRTSSISWSTTFSSIGMSLSSTANLNQNMRDSSVAMTLPDLNVSISRFYPFRRKHMVGNQRWYEKISMSYTGHLSNSINTKEDRLMKANLLKDWRNGIQHSIPVSGSFTLLNYVNVSPSFNFTDRMYSRKVERSWDTAAQKEKNDTTYGFHNVYDWNLALSASTKLYGFFVPNKKIFGDKVMAIRHVITPSVSFSYAPDFGSARYGYYGTYQKTDAHGNVSLVEYSPYEGALYGVPGKGKSGNISWDISNNLEMKIKSDHDKDSLGYKKISLIDELGLTMSYNSAATTHKWSDLSMRIRLKWWKNYTFNMNAVFGTYAYELDANGTPYIGNHTLWGMGKFGRFQGFSQNLSFTLTPEKLRKWFGGGNSEDEEAPGRDKEGVDTDIESNIDEDMIEG
ncbi:MAG: putative LPS assembly protein LptD, partial [Prevotella sp.]